MKDVVAVGLDLKPNTLISAYSQGVFHWQCKDMPLLWHCPMKRAILKFDEFHYPRRLKQYIQKAPWHYTINKAFDQVITQSQDRGLEGTWITPEMKDAYRELHRLGYAHSVEVWNGKNLIGGLYGVDIGGYFAGESMFHREDNASKGAIVFVIALLKMAKRSWMDIQVLTPHMSKLGAAEITRRKFLGMLANATEEQKEKSSIKPFSNENLLEKYDYNNFSTFIENDNSFARKKTALSD